MPGLSYTRRRDDGVASDPEPDRQRDAPNARPYSFMEIALVILTIVLAFDALSGRIAGHLRARGENGVESHSSGHKIR